MCMLFIITQYVCKVILDEQWPANFLAVGVVPHQVVQHVAQVRRAVDETLVAAPGLHQLIP